MKKFAYLLSVLLIAGVSSSASARQVVGDSLNDKSSERIMDAAAHLYTVSAGYEYMFEGCRSFYKRTGSNAALPAMKVVLASNQPVANLAMLRMMALVDWKNPKGNKREWVANFSKEARGATIKKIEQFFQSTELSERFCSGLGGKGATEFLLTEKYPDEVSLLVGAEIGYPVQFDDCEFATIFLSDPDVFTSEEGGRKAIVSMSKAVDPFPAVRASCYLVEPNMAHEEAAMKSVFAQKIRETKLTETVWQTARTPLGLEIQVHGDLYTVNGKMKVLQKLFVGKRSALEVLVMEPDRHFPSVASAEFLGNIVRVR